MSVEMVVTVDAPEPFGPYSQACAAAGLLFCSTQLPIQPETGELISGSVREQASRCLANLEAVCNAARTSLDNALRVTIYFTDRSVMRDVNSAFEERFATRPPARVPIHVTSLSRDASITMDAVVALDSSN
jgi:2-iminobutanoate/2-iminopropanoate deaminase